MQRKLPIRLIGAAAVAFVSAAAPVRAQRDTNVANDNSDEFSLERAEEFEKRFGTVGGAVSPPPRSPPNTAISMSSPSRA